MALRFIDSFDHYANADKLKKWTSGPNLTITAGAGRFGTAAAVGYNNELVKNLDNQATWIVGCAYKFNNTGSGVIFCLWDASDEQCTLELREPGVFVVTRDAWPGYATIASSAIIPLTLQTWYFVEFKATIANAGSFAVRLNGQEILSGSGDIQATANAYANRASVRSAVAVDDVYICDGTGTRNNDFLGDRRVIALYPSGAGASSDFTPSAGSGYQCVDEANMNNDTDYVSSATAGHKSLFTFGDIAIAGNIAGIQLIAAARKDDAGSRTFRQVARPGVTDRPGATVSVADGYIMHPEVLELNPDTSNPWTVAEVNAAQFGVELVS